MPINLIGMREGEVREYLASHPRNRDASDFLHRRGRFADIEESTDEREQVFPGPPPDIMRQTHRPGAYHDGS